MNARHLEDIELGERVALHLIIENELHRDSRRAAIAYRCEAR